MISYTMAQMAKREAQEELEEENEQEAAAAMQAMEEALVSGLIVSRSLGSLLSARVRPLQASLAAGPVVSPRLSCCALFHFTDFTLVPSFACSDNLDRQYSIQAGPAPKD